MLQSMDKAYFNNKKIGVIWWIKKIFQIFTFNSYFQNLDKIVLLFNFEKMTSYITITAWG